MTVTITPGKLRGTVAVPSSKYELHRLCICAALADATTEISYRGMSQDIEATLSCLSALGADCSITTDVIRVSPVSRGTGRARLDCGESGSTLRFLLPVAAAVADGADFFGKGRLPQRPLEPLLSELRRHGCGAEPNLAGGGIVSVSGRLTAGEYTLPGDVSSQFISGLLFALPLLGGDSEIRLTSPLESSGYVRMTIDAMRKFGVPAGWGAPELLSVGGGQRYRSPGPLAAEGDWSAAAFWLAADYLGGHVKCDGLNIHSTQGDREIVTLLRRLREADGKHAVEIDASQIPDLVPALAVAAAVAPVATRIYNAARLRIKESDRLAAIANAINALGGRAEEQPDGLLIHGGRLTGGTVDGCNDHRIVMACAIAATACREPVNITGAEAVRKTYPAFFDDFALLGGVADVV